MVPVLNLLVGLDQFLLVGFYFLFVFVDFSFESAVVFFQELEGVLDLSHPPDLCRVLLHDLVEEKLGARPGHGMLPLNASPQIVRVEAFGIWIHFNEGSFVHGFLPFDGTGWVQDCELRKVIFSHGFVAAGTARVLVEMRIGASCENEKRT